MGKREIEVICQNPGCGSKHKKLVSEVTRAKKRGSGLYCGLRCAAVHRNVVLGNTAPEVDKQCVVCGSSYRVRDIAKARKTCSEDCANVLRYNLSPEAKNRQRAAGKDKASNLIPVHETLKKREAWKYVELRALLIEHGYLFEFEEPIGPYVVDLAIGCAGAIVEFDGPYHANDCTWI